MNGRFEETFKVEVTQLLRAWVDGDRAALDKLAPMVERELHQLAHRYMNRERPNHTLQTTALVNEVYLRLLDVPQVTWQDRAHFFAMSARMMRHILTDFARSRNYQKRGGEAVHVTLEDDLAAIPGRSVDVLALDDALQQLAKSYPRQSQVVELRFFGGLSAQETAEVMKVSLDTVKRDWKFAKVWLLRELTANKGYAS
jgi:RNA polymerase sigma-70 factor, ECF subfamily